MALVVIGAAGEMCRVAVERFAAVSDAPIVLADLNVSILESLAAKLPAGRASIKKLDLFDKASLNETIQGAALVVLGAGPYMRTSEPVLNACLEAKVPYLDFDDDVQSTQAALDLQERAKEAGVPCYIGCGASPGMSNVMVVDAVRELDTVESLDICWLVGDERGATGKAVLEHLMHIAAGPCLTWADGKAAINESWVETMYAPMLGEEGETLLHETAHPEPVTLPRIFPTAKRIRCTGALGPAPFNGIARGLGQAVRRNALSMKEAVDFLFELTNKEPSTEGLGTMFGEMTAAFRGGDITVKELFQLVGHVSHSLSPWRYALYGIMETIWTGECTTGEVLSFLVNSARGKRVENKGALLVRAVGLRNGHPATITKRTAKSGENTFLSKTMGTVTGTATAAFTLLALEDGLSRSGVYCPEDWAEPERFYQALERLGTPKDELVITL
ncbi:Saccharopine dehydrogenase-domain-containing protein [Aspergillus floccosus]